MFRFAFSIALGLALAATCVPGLARAGVLRDVREDIPNVRVSEHFALKWGSALEITEVDDALADLETVWRVVIDEMGYPPPHGCPEYLFNVYVGDTGEEVPAAGGAQGYFWTDEEEYPYVVIRPPLDVNRRGAVFAHEFFHAVQNATGRFPYAEAGGWFHEASAEWIVGEVFPDSPAYAELLFGYAFQPHLGLTSFGLPDPDPIDELHAFGAFLFLQYLAEHVSDRALVRALWVDATDTLDPIAAFEEQLRWRGHTLSEVFVDFAAHNAVLDYERRDLFAALLLDAASEWSDRSVVDSVPAALDSGWRSAPSSTRPHALGANTIALPSTIPGAVTIEWHGDQPGLAAVLVVDGVVPRYERIERTITVRSTGESDMFLVVAATSLETDEPADYSYRVKLAPDAPDRLPPGGCAAVPPMGWAVVFAGLVFRRMGARRRAVDD